jgi:hypothetical protein
MFRHSIIRLFLALAAAAAVVTYFGVPYISDALSAGYRLQAEHRAGTLLRASEDQLRNLVERHDRAGLRAFLALTVTDHSWLQSLVLCRNDGTIISQSDHTPSDVVCRPEDHPRDDASQLIQTTAGRLQISDYQIVGIGHAPFRAVVVQDLGFADWSQSGWRGFVVAFVGLTALGLALLVSFVIWWLLRRWATLLAGVGRSISSIGRAMDTASRGGPNAREIWLPPVPVGSAGDAVTGAWLGASERGIGVLGTGWIGRSVLATTPATAQAMTVGSQT